MILTHSNEDPITVTDLQQIYTTSGSTNFLVPIDLIPSLTSIPSCSFRPLDMGYSFHYPMGLPLFLVWESRIDTRNASIRRSWNSVWTTASAKRIDYCNSIDYRNTLILLSQLRINFLSIKLNIYSLWVTVSQKICIHRNRLSSFQIPPTVLSHAPQITPSPLDILHISGPLLPVSSPFRSSIAALPNQITRSRGEGNWEEVWNISADGAIHSSSYSNYTNAPFSKREIDVQKIKSPSHLKITKDQRGWITKTFAHFYRMPDNLNHKRSNRLSNIPTVFVMTKITKDQSVNHKLSLAHFYRILDPW